MADGEPCKVYGSNAGHLLFCGVPSKERAAAVAAQLLSEPLFQRLGIRTLARANRATTDVLSQWLDLAARYVGVCCRYLTLRGARRGGPDRERHLRDGDQFGMRLPELYCGSRAYPARGRHRIGGWPAAGWSRAPCPVAAGEPWDRIDGRRNEVHIRRPMLPSISSHSAYATCRWITPGSIWIPPHRRGVVVVPASMSKASCVCSRTCKRESGSQRMPPQYSSVIPCRQCAPYGAGCVLGIREQPYLVDELGRLQVVEPATERRVRSSATG